MPSNATVFSARFLNDDLNERKRDDSKKESIDDKLDGGNNKVYHLGKVKPREFGYVQLTLKPINGTKAADVAIDTRIASADCRRKRIAPS